MPRYTKIPLSLPGGSLAQYLKEIGEFALLGPKEEKKLARKAKQGDEGAKAQLVQANLRFVVSVAKGYMPYGLPLQDLINEGNLGLIQAADRFDPERGFKFISYAVWWIRQSMMMALDKQGHLIRIPGNYASLAHRIFKAINQLQQETGETPSMEEIAEELDTKPEALERSLSLGRHPWSLDAPLPGQEASDDSPTSLYEVTPNTQTPAPDEAAASEAISSTIGEVIATLNDPLEEAIIKLRFGLDGKQAMTLEEVGDRFYLTRERVRQIEKRALNRLKHASRLRRLAELAT